MVVDDDTDVDRWMKPGKAQFQIEYRSGEAYEPDFVVEAKDRFLICEVKDEKELTDPTVQAKASAAMKWCHAASGHATSNGGKPRGYLLIPDDQVLANSSVAGLAIKFART